MIISPQNQYVYVSVPKTGTHTMYATLCDHFDGVQQEGPYHQKDIPLEYSEFFAFSTCRHPFDRAVSVWHALTRRPNYQEKYIPIIGDDTFLSYARWISGVTPTNRPTGRGGVLLLSQSEWLEGVRLDQVLKLEQLDTLFSALPFVKDAVSLPKLLAREHETWDDVKCDESHNLLRQRFAGDFRRFDYSDQF